MSVNPKKKQVDRTALSVALTVGLYGAAFGAAGVTAGFCFPYSVINFSGRR